MFPATVPVLRSGHDPASVPDRVGTGGMTGREEDGEMNSPLQKREGSERQDGALPTGSGQVPGRRYDPNGAEECVARGEWHR
jgi:hypothetical protein